MKQSKRAEPTLPARALLDKLRLKRIRLGAKVVDLDGPVSEIGGFVPLGWIDDCVNASEAVKDADELKNCRDSMARVSYCGQRVFSQKHGLGYVTKNYRGGRRAIGFTVSFDDGKVGNRFYMDNVGRDLSSVDVEVNLDKKCSFVGGSAERFPESHSKWDEAALLLSDAWKMRTFATLVDTLPELSAKKEDLHESYLLRAAAMFAWIAHGYFHYGGSRSLPGENIMEPWMEVSRRLGRCRPHMNVFDQYLANWFVNNRETSTAIAKAAALINDYPDSQRTNKQGFRAPTIWKQAGIKPTSLPQISSLFPFFGDRNGGFPASENFFMAMVVMHMVSAPLIELCVQSQEACMRNDGHGLVVCLTEIKAVIEETTVAFLQISPNKESPTYVDPVQFTHTIATIALPIPPGNDGAAASGLMAPFIHLLDCFFERKSYHSHLGRAAYSERQKSMPKNILNFVEAIKKVSVRTFVRQSNDDILIGKWNSAINAYCGEDGFLGIHALKASGYLEASVKVGRIETNGTGEVENEDDLSTCTKELAEGDFRRKQWLLPVTSMHKSRMERYEMRVAGKKMPAPSTFRQIRIKNRQDASRCPFSGKSKPGTYVGREDVQTDGKLLINNDVTDQTMNQEAFSSCSSAHVSLDISNSGFEYCPGDIAIMAPQNGQEVIAKTAQDMGLYEGFDEEQKLAVVDKLKAELVVPNSEWREYAAEVGLMYSQGTFLSVYDILQNGMITCLSTDVVLRVLKSSPVFSVDDEVIKTIKWTGALGDTVWSIGDLYYLMYKGRQDLARCHSTHLLDGTLLCDTVPPYQGKMFLCCFG